MHKALKALQQFIDKISPRLAGFLGKAYRVGWYRQIKKASLVFAKIGIPITQNERALLDLSNLYRGRRIFVIGNGPSLTVSDLEKLKDEVTIGANKIYLCFSESAWRPTVYCSEDPLMIKKLDFLDRILPPSMLKIIPDVPGIAGRLKNSILIQLIKTKFYEVPRTPKFSDNALSGIYWGSTVTYTCIQLACHLGANEIYLLGVDCDYTVDKGQEKGDAIYTSHGEYRNHFHPDYDKEGEKYYPPNLDRHELAFKAVVEYCNFSKLKVFNATRGGKLEMFPRVDLDAVLRETTSFRN